MITSVNSWFVTNSPHLWFLKFFTKIAIWIYYIRLICKYQRIHFKFSFLWFLSKMTILSLLIEILKVFRNSASNSILRPTIQIGYNFIFFCNMRWNFICLCTGECRKAQNFFSLWQLFEPIFSWLTEIKLKRKNIWQTTWR